MPNAHNQIPSPLDVLIAKGSRLNPDVITTIAKLNRLIDLGIAVLELQLTALQQQQSTSSCAHGLKGQCDHACPTLGCMKQANLCTQVACDDSCAMRGCARYRTTGDPLITDGDGLCC